MKINSIDYFRGIAILLVVAGHSYGSWVIDTIGEKTIVNLVSGGTVLFVFISGFLFHHIYYSKFKYIQFMFNKFKYVFFPFIILSAAGIIWFVVLKNSLPIGSLPIEPKLTRWEDYVMYLLKGQIFIEYWYIPFAMIIFLMSPIFLKQITLPIKVQITIFTVLVCFSMVAYRPMYNLSPIHSVIYFFPVYMFGIICSIEKAAVFRLIEGKSIILGIIVLTNAIVQAVLYTQVGALYKAEIFSFEGVDINIIQKLFMCLFFLSLFNHYEKKNIPILKYLASTSFAVYLLHPWVLEFLIETGVPESINFLPDIAIFVLMTLAEVFISMLAAAFIKAVFKEQSRFLIGW